MRDALVELPVNAVWVFAGQWIAFALAARVRHLPRCPAWRITLASMLLGLPLGLLFDLLIGQERSIFTYEGVAHDALFFALNGILSYGSAIATARIFPVPTLPRASKRQRYLGAAVILLVLSTVAYLPSWGLHRLPSLLSWGAVIIGIGECAFLAARQLGPIAALSKGEWRPICVLWICSATTGAAYEALNWAFPLWRWHGLEGVANWQVEALVVALGYVVLFHPMTVLSRLVIPESFTHRACPTTKP
jgi:hypothetical protein